MALPGDLACLLAQGRSSRPELGHWAGRIDGIAMGGVAFEATGRSFRRVTGHPQLWILKGALEASVEQQKVAAERITG